MADPDTPPGNQNDGEISLALPLDTICFIVAKAREFDVKTPSTDPGASRLDDDDIAAATLEDRPSDPVEDELRAIIADLSFDAGTDLVALMWLGRDGTGPEDWSGIRQRAEERRTEDTADYLLGTLLLADHLSAGLALMGRDCIEFMRGHG